MTSILLKMMILVPFLFGCAGRAPFRQFNATTPISALDEIAARRRTLNNVITSMTIRLETPKGIVHIRCKATIENGNYWQLEFTGPLGVDLASIELKGDRFIMKNLQQGETINGYIDETLYIPNLDVEFPPLRYLATMLIPYPNITYPQEWSVVNSIVSEQGKLDLEHIGDHFVQRIDLYLNYNPLRIKKETIEFTGLGTMSREFNYRNDKSFLPETVNISFNELLLNIAYNSFTINKSISQPSQTIPL